MASKITVFTDTLTNIDYNINLPILTDSEATAYLNGKIAEINNILNTKIEKYFPANTEVPVTEYLNYNIDTRKLFNMIIKWVYSPNTNIIYGYKRDSKITNELPASVYKVNGSEGTIDLTAVYTTDRTLPTGGYASVPSTNYYYKTGTDRWYVFKAVANNSLIDLPLVSPYNNFPVYGGYGFTLIYYSSNTNSIKVCGADKATGYAGASVHNPITWLSNVPASKVSQPTISGDPTADIDTDTGNSEAQDSEDNVGGDGHVTLINNVVNYDNYLSNYSRLDTGFITAYEISPSQLVALHSFLYSETITDMIKNFFAGDASKAIIDLFNIPVAPNTEAASSVINIGVIPSGASANAIKGETVTFDFGSIDITANSYYSNSFMDLSPYNQYSIYLPYIGFRNLSTNDVRSINDNGFKIYLKYVVDVLTGDFVAIVEADHNNCAVDNDTGTVTTAKLTKQLINVYNGSMRTDIPLSYRNPLQGLMPIMSGLASTMFTMATASASGATDMQQLSTTMNSGMSTLNNIGSVNNSLMARSDSISGSVGNLSLRTAFIINQECPKYIRTGKSNQFSGYPVYKFMQLNDDRGYVKVRNVIASNFPGTAHEQEMVVSLLKKGVWCK